jgi:hypothetical protein
MHETTSLPTLKPSLARSRSVNRSTFCVPGLRPLFANGNFPPDRMRGE